MCTCVLARACAGDYVLTNLGYLNSFDFGVAAAREREIPKKTE